MEIPFDWIQFAGSSEKVTSWNAKRLAQLRGNPNIQKFYQLINAIGEWSRKSQGLNSVLTSTARLREHPSFKLYLCVDNNRLIGLLKIGAKKLYIRRQNGMVIEMEPLCVLDFYVVESEQRHGYGKALFEAICQEEERSPGKFAIDRPSPKFLGFLRKHYQLETYVPQGNNFVVFNEYFEDLGIPSPDDGDWNRQGRPSFLAENRGVGLPQRGRPAGSREIACGHALGRRISPTKSSKTYNIITGL